MLGKPLFDPKQPSPTFQLGKSSINSIIKIINAPYFKDSFTEKNINDMAVMKT